MRVAVLEVGRWHAPLACAGLERADCEVTAVSAREPGAAAPWVARFGCRVYPTPTALLDAERVEFAFVFGIHREMPATARLLIERGVACSIEKPAGTCAADVAALSAIQRRVDGFVSVPFVNRLSPLVRRLRAGPGGREQPAIVHMSFVDIAGSPERYVRAGCGWMLDHTLAGGGCLINLGVHFIDLFSYLTGRPARLAGAAMSNTVHGLVVEDHARVLLADDHGATCLVEVGYTYPDDGERHQAYRFAGRDWFAEARDGSCHVVRMDESETFSAPIDAAPLYTDYVLATLRAAELGGCRLPGSTICMR